MGYDRLWLPNEPYVQVYPALAERLGLERAFILVRLDYLVYKHGEDGWLSWPASRLRERGGLTCIPLSSLKKHLASLAEMGLLVRREGSGVRPQSLSVVAEAVYQLLGQHPCVAPTEPLVAQNETSIRNKEASPSPSQDLSLGEGGSGGEGMLALDALQKLRSIMATGYAVDLRGEVKQVYTEVFQEAEKLGRDPFYAGSVVTVAYMEWCLGRELAPIERQWVGALVRKYSKLAVIGVDAVVRKGRWFEGPYDVPDNTNTGWLQYAMATCAREVRDRKASEMEVST